MPITRITGSFLNYKELQLPATACLDHLKNLIKIEPAERSVLRNIVIFAASGPLLKLVPRLFAKLGVIQAINVKEFQGVTRS